jgi:23S rRNA pseudouridine2605 synthase
VIVSFNKPKWFVVSKEDKHNKTIFELLPSSWKKDFYYIGRLDKDSHWLLLLTNSPELVNYFENPKSRIIKIYEVKINKLLKDRHISIMKKWIPVNEEWESIKDVAENKNSKSKIELLKFYDVTKTRTRKNWEILRILLKEWKKRHIRRLLNAFDYKVLDLKRIKVWKYEIGNIKIWKYMINKSISWAEQTKYSKKKNYKNEI